MRRKPSPKECKVCEWRVRRSTHGGDPLCNLLARTGICRVKEPELVDENGGCRWFRRDLTLDGGAKAPGRRRSVPVAQIDREGEVMTIYPSAPEAAKATGLSLITVYNAVHWQKREAAGDVFSGRPGRKGFTFRYINDATIKEALTRYDQGRNDSRLQTV